MKKLILGISLSERLFLSLDYPVIASPQFNQDRDNTTQLITSPQVQDIDEKSLLEQSFKMIDEIDNPQLKYISDNTTQLITSPQVQDIDEEYLLDQSLEMIDEMDDSQLKISLLNDLALSYAQLGNQEKALIILNQALSIAESFEDVVLKVTTTTNIAKYYAQIGQKQQAIKILDNAVEIVSSVTDKSQQGQLLLDISFKYRDIGEKETANTLLAQSQTIIAEVDWSAPEFPFPETPPTVKLGFSGWVRSFRETKALAGIDIDLYKQWSEDDIFVDANIFIEYDNSRSVNNYRPGSLTFTFYRHHFNDRWSFFTDLFGATNQSLLSSRNKNDDLTIIGEAYVGAGLNLWRGDTPSDFLDLQIGVGPRYEYDFIDFEQRRNELNPALAIILWGRGFSVGEVRINELFSLVPTLNNLNNYDIVSDTQLSVPLSKKWSFTNRLFLRYRNEEIFEGNPKWLFFFTTGLEYDF